MAKDSRLAKLRDMEPVIGTFTARDVVSNPDFVNQTYLEHADTHMSLGNTADYVATLLRWAKTNKGAVIGGISGEYGYGKTSTAIHLWQQCERARVVAVPPFEWHRLQDIMDTTWAWVRCRVGQIQPGAMSELDQIYDRCREKSIQEFADEEGVAVSKVQALVERGRINLRCHPEDVVDFLAQVSRFLEGDTLQLYGPVVFTDELQVTMARYTDEHRSRDEFMQDLFDLFNPLINQQGSFGLMVSMPLSTEALISDIRPDILQRLQNCGLLIRPNTLYERDFPSTLWRKFAQVFEFGDIASDILPDDTLDSMGQIAFRADLGAGPRTVIEAMRCAIDHYDHTGQSYSPINLMDSYLARKVAFDAGGKLIVAVTEVLQSKDVQQTPDGEQAVKLMAAFPMGCPEERFETYGVQDAKDEIAKRVYAEYLFKFPEGISLRRLATTDRPAEPRFIELTKNFIQTYSESNRDIDAAVRAFGDVVIREQLLTARRADQIEGWIADPKVPEQYIGTFDRRYPERKLLVRVSRARRELAKPVEELGLAFWLDSDCDQQPSVKIERANEAGTLALFRLELLRRSSTPFNIPYIEELGYPLRKVTPTFMLALVEHLRANGHLIPEDEKRIQVPPFVRSLVSYAVQLLLGEYLLDKSEFENLSKVGLALPQEVFARMCQAKYPDYETLITTGRWKPAYATYLRALGSQAVSSSLGKLRGNRTVELPHRELLTLFGETRVQPVRALAENLPTMLDIDLETRSGAPSSVRFRLHPAEEAFLEALRGSKETFRRGEVKLRVLGALEGFALLCGLGYREEEISTILQILKARRLIDHDQKHQCFVEVLESPDERREALLAVLADLVQRAAALAQIPDFERERFQAIVGRLAKDIAATSDIEELEEHQAELGKLRDEQARFVKTWELSIQTQFDHIRQETGSVLRASLPADLTHPLKGDVNWVGELVQCQALLKDKYQRSAAAFRNVESRITTGWNAWTSASTQGPTAFLVLYEVNLTAQSEMKEARAELEAAAAYLRSYIAWSNVLNVASRAYREATGCEVSYQEKQFRLALDVIFAEIASQFEKRRLEALPQHEMYADQIKGVQEQIDAWLRNRRGTFMDAKRFYEDTLKAVSVERFNLHASFDPFDPETSRINLHSEVLEKALQRVHSLQGELERHRTETLYAGQVVGADVSETSAQIGQVRDELAHVRKQVHDQCVRQPECFAARAEDLGRLADAIQEIGQSLRGVLHKRPPTPEEEAVLDVLQDPRGTDLAVVIASQLAGAGSEFSLDFLLERITSLFKKNQIVIRLERRR